MGKILLVGCYDGWWDDNNRCVDNRILGILVNDDASYLFLLELIYKELHLDFHEQYVHLFVHMQFESTGNGIMEIMSDGAVS